MTDLERQLALLQRDNAYMTDLLERADALIVKKNAILDRIRREFFWLMATCTAAGFVAGICVTRLWWRL